MRRGHIFIIGGGKMGLAIARNMDNVEKTVITRRAEQSQFITEKYGIESHNSPPPLEGNDTILLAVKPKDAESALEALAPLLGPENLLISVMAGVSMKTLSTKAQTKRVIRAMPNMCSLIGMGMTAYYIDPELKHCDKQYFQSVFERLGKLLEVSSEDALNRATAICGSGPAYLFYLAESMQKVAQELGMSAEDADLLVRQTLAGTGRLLLDSDHSPAELRAMITSPGGTTQAACEYFDSQNMQEIIIQGCHAAYQKAAEISHRTS